MKKQALIVGLVVVAVVGGAAVVLFGGSGSLSGSVVDDAGNPVGQCSITPRGPSFSGEERGVVTLDDGTWTWGMVGNGPYSVAAVCPRTELRQELRGTSDLVVVHGAATVTITVVAE